MNLHMINLLIAQWVIPAAYFGIALLCAYCAFNIQRTTGLPHRGLHARFLWGLALIFLLLGLNSIMHFTGDLTRYGRLYAARNGWLTQRRGVQYRLIVGIACIAMLAASLVGWHLRHILRHYWLTLLATTCLLSLIAIQAISLHNVDVMLNQPVIGLRLMRALELSGILLAALPLVVRQRSKLTQMAQHR